MDNSKLLFILIGIILIAALFNSYTTFNIYKRLAASAIAPNEQPTPTAPAKVDVGLGDNPAIKGSQDAPVTIIEFSDFECPFCGRFVTQTLPQIEEKYIKTGKVKMVFRNYPLPFHQYAQKAAEAVECAKEQGKFWEYHNVLFQNQKALALDNLKEYAATLKFDTNKFNECLNSNKMAAEITKDINDATEYIKQYKLEENFGTPAFFINGEPLIGAQPFSEFEKVIDKKLQEAK